MDNDKTFGVPKIAGQVGGLFAGATVGWKAGDTIGGEVADHLPGAFHDHAGLVAHSLATAGAFGCAYVGSLLAARKPGEAVIAAAAVLAQYGASQVSLPSHASELSSASAPAEVDDADMSDDSLRNQDATISDFNHDHSDIHGIF